MKRSNCIALALSLVLLAVAGKVARAYEIAGANVTAGYLFGGNLNDISGNNYNGTLNNGGTAAYGAGPGGRSAFSFNGNTSVLTTTMDNLGTVNHSFTVDAWVNFTNPQNGDLAVFGTSQGGNNVGMHLQERAVFDNSHNLVAGPAIMMGFYNNDLQPNVPVISGSTWYNVAWVYNASLNGGTQEIFENGVLVASRSGAGPFLGTGENAYIGQDCCGGLMNGAISNLFVFNSALNVDQVNQVMNAVVPEPSSFALIGFAAVGLVVAARRRRRA